MRRPLKLCSITLGVVVAVVLLITAGMVIYSRSDAFHAERVETTRIAAG